MHEYKVITEKDSRFLGTFDPETLEHALNEYAGEGWRLINAFHVAANVHKSPGARIMAILERAKQ